MFETFFHAVGIVLKVEMIDYTSTRSQGHAEEIFKGRGKLSYKKKK